MLALLLAVPVVWLLFLGLLAKLEAMTLGTEDHGSKILPAADIPAAAAPSLEELTGGDSITAPAVAAALQPAVESRT
ncbi:MAG: hypothetical protein ACRDIU_11095 [Actinomycetota bacterium]